MFLRVLFVAVILFAEIGIFVGLQQITYSLQDNPLHLVSFIGIAFIGLIVTGKKCFDFTFHKSQIESIMKEYKCSLERAEELLPILQHQGPYADIPEHRVRK